MQYWLHNGPKENYEQLKCADFESIRKPPHRLSGGKGRTVRDGVNASMQSSREHCSMNAQVVELGNVEVRK
jgi:hypothetical protein